MVTGFANAISVMCNAFCVGCLIRGGYLDRVDSFDEAVARVEGEVAGAQELAERARGFLDSLADVRGVGVDRDERVRVEVDASGNVVGLEIEEDPELGGAVVEALEAARAERLARWHRS